MAEEATATETTNQVEEEATSQSQEAGDVTPRSTESYEQEIEKLRRENAKYRTERNEYRDDAEAFRKIQEAEKTELLLSMPGIGSKTAAQILMTVGDMSDFPTAGQASYAGCRHGRTNLARQSCRIHSTGREIRN